MKTLLSEREIEKRVLRMSRDVSCNYSQLDPLVLVVMDGAFMFAADLIRGFSFRHTIEFIRMQSYLGTNSVMELTEPRIECRDRHVLIVEDIVDTGKTVAILNRALTKQGALTVRTCALLDKPSRRRVEREIYYLGFTIENLFVVGYGMDYNGMYRNLSEIKVLEEEDKCH